MRLSYIAFASVAALLGAVVFLLIVSPGYQRIADFRTLGELRVATRVDALSYRADENGTYAGFEHDLLIALGRRLEVPVRFISYPDTEHAIEAVIKGQAHLAAAGLTRNSQLPLAWTAGLRDIDFVLVGRSGRRGIARERDLAGRVVTVRHGTKLAETVDLLRQHVATLKIVHVPPTTDDEDLLMQTAAGQIDLLATERTQYALASRYAPKLTIAYDLPFKSTVSWALPLHSNDGLASEINGFLNESSDNGLLARIADRYFGHIRRLDNYDIAAFIARTQTRLPPYLTHFREAAARTGLDWRYLAALSYQESQWDPEATSYTGVRGLMMLTVDTANRLGIDDRLDPKQAIFGGARYLSMLQKKIPGDVPYPDRMWMVTAAYNIGLGGIINARTLARQLGRNDTSWAELKTVLPLLSNPHYASQFRTGPARGGEALIMAENIRNFYDILRRTYPVDQPLLVESARAKAANHAGPHLSAQALMP
ncbi:MAG: membrane-bound lytic murein transglycosylase MltF [Azoarcus sp.]|nr:membrane-bound lytic murein transglycosylase MltF [Azoarcus sp.]